MRWRSARRDFWAAASHCATGWSSRCGNLRFNKEWWPGSESNQRHADFQSAALPTELPGHLGISPNRGLDQGARIRTAGPKGVKQGAPQNLDLWDIGTISGRP